jgi:hypothetical protein
MNKARQLYEEDEESSAPAETSSINYEKIFSSQADRTKFNMVFHQLKMDDKLERYNEVLTFTMSNKECIQHGLLMTFIKANFKIFQKNFRDKHYEYRILQKYWEILDLMLNHRTADFNEMILDEEIKLIQNQMNEFLAKQNQAKKTKKNQKIRQRMRRQRERLEKEVKQNENEKINDVEFVELD